MSIKEYNIIRNIYVNGGYSSVIDALDENLTPAINVKKVILMKC